MWIYVKKLHLLLWRTPKDRRSGWKPIPSVARVTGTKSRDYKARKDDCLEDSTQLICSFAFGSVRTRSKGSRIKPMRRIKPPSCPPWGMKGLALATWGSSWQSVTKEKPLQGGGGEGLKIRRIGVIRDWFWTWRASQRRVSTSYGVLSSRQLSLTFLIPETSSRVTLAALGIGFQPNHTGNLAYEDE